MVKKTGCLFVTAYLLLMFGIYPFYMKEGYADIGRAKYEFFIYSSLATLGILALIGIISGGQALGRRMKRREPYLLDWDRLSAMDLLMMLYATEIVLSCAFSDYPREALWGTEGWYMGAVPVLTLCGLYFFISRFWKEDRFLWQVSLLASGAVFLLGILDRFSIYLIPLELRAPSFISTLGNINWFCGYLSVMLPIGICLFLFGGGYWGDGGKSCLFAKLFRWLYMLYIVIGFMAGLCQGSSSVFLFFAALFYILLWISVQKREWIRDYFLLVFLWGFSAQAIRVMRLFIPEGYNYDRDNLCARVTDSNLSLWVGIAGLCIYLLLWKKRSGDFDGEGPADGITGKEKRCRIIHRTMLILLAAGVLGWAALTGINTWIGIPFLAQREELLFNQSWGNGRGAAIYSAVKMYEQMPLLRKLLGVGPDCFSAYAYSLPETAAMLRDNFGDSRLTNAHNELLTCLVNTGILGVSLYIALLVSFIRKGMKKGKENPAFYLFSVCVVCYLVHNMVSFAQVLNFPFVFLILGMGEGFFSQYR